MVKFYGQTAVARVTGDDGGEIYISRKEAAYLAVKINQWLGYRRR